MLFSLAPVSNAVSSPAALRRRGIAIFLAVVLLVLHSFGEALHYRAHLPTQGEQTRRAIASRHDSYAKGNSASIKAASFAAFDDDDCAFCALTAMAARFALLSAPTLATPAVLALGRMLPLSSARIIASCRARAPGPPRAPPVSFA